jgi:predicted peptidase
MFNKILTSALLSFVLFSIGLKAQESLFSKEYYVNSDNDTLHYRKMISDYDAKSSYPLVIFLHGSGERGSDNNAQLKWGVQNFAQNRIMANYRPIVIAPQCPLDDTWGNYDYKSMKMFEEPTKTMKLLIELIEQSIENMPVDKNRVYITGLSMGAYGTFDILSRRPELFTAAVPVCGAGDISMAEKFAHVPIWIFHGAQDDVVDPIHSIKMYKALLDQESTPGFTMYPEAGHFSWVPAYSDQMMMDWIFSQRK